MSKTQIPSLNELLSSPTLKPWLDRLNPGAVISTARNVIEEIGAEVFSAASEKRMPDVGELAQKIVTRLQEIQPKHGGLPLPIVNGTGTIFHETFGGPPMTAEALEPLFCMAGRAGADLYENRQHSIELIRELTEAEDAIVFTNFAAAKMVVLASLAFNKEIVISRAEVYDSDEGYRLTDLLRLTGARLREVGSVNRTVVDDYTAALDENVGLIYLSSGVGTGCEFSLDKSEPESVKRLIDTVRRKTPILLEVEFASICDLKPYGVEKFPCLKELAGMKPDLVLFRSNRLIGGPECGVLLGKKSLLDIVRKSSLIRAFAASPIFLAALESVLDLYAKSEDWAAQGIPVIQTIASSEENIKNRAVRLLPQIQASEAVESAVIENCRTIFVKSCPEISIPSYCISITPNGRTAAEMAAWLLEAEPSLAARYDNERVHIDLRTIPAKFDTSITEIFNPADS